MAGQGIARMELGAVLYQRKRALGEDILHLFGFVDVDDYDSEHPFENSSLFLFEQRHFVLADEILNLQFEY